MEWMLMPYRRYADFKGRSRRKEYWMFALLMFIVYAVLAGLMLAGGLTNFIAVGDTGASPSFGPLFWLGAVLFGIFALVSFIPAIAVTVRRLHDRDLSGWWYLGVIIGGAIPLVGPLISIGFLVFMCLQGTPGPNRFGPDPKDPANADVFA